MVPQFYIVNDIDRPCERLVTQAMGDKLEYLTEDLRDYPAMQLSDEATNLVEYGFAIGITGDVARFVKIGPSMVEYKDGSIREWQGAPMFDLKMKKPKGKSND